MCSSTEVAWDVEGGSERGMEPPKSGKYHLAAAMGHFHVCDDSAAPCDDPEDQMVVAVMMHPWREYYKGKEEESTYLTDTGFIGELEHLKIETTLIDEMFSSVMGEYVLLKW